MITVRYTKAQYMARITELEGYHGQLQQHLEKLEELREQVFVFWEDANAEKIGKILDIQIRQVQNSMDRTHDLLIFYKSAVEKLDAAIGTNALTEEENAWARLLRYYLANPNNGDYSDYPKTPEELPS